MTRIDAAAPAAVSRESTEIMRGMLTRRTLAGRAADFPS
jgi:hypothetical protein